MSTQDLHVPPVVESPDVTPKVEPELPAGTLAEFDEILPIPETAKPKDQAETPPAVLTGSATPSPPAAALTAPEPATETAVPAAPVAPPPAVPAAQPKHEYKADEEFSVRDGVNLRRDQIGFLLDAYEHGSTRDREQAETFRGIFRVNDADQAAKQWKPVIDYLVKDVEEGGQAPMIMQGAIDLMQLGGRDAQQYLNRALQTLANHLNQHPAKEAAAKGDPELRGKVVHLEQRIAEQDQKAANDQVAHERSEITAQYPVLADPQIWGMFAASMVPIALRHPGYTLVQHAKAVERELKLWQDAYALQQPPKLPDPPAQIVPSGAAPGATRVATDQKPKTFTNLDDEAVIDDFIAAYPNGLT